MFTARAALSRHVGRGVAGAPFRREVGRGRYIRAEGPRAWDGGYILGRRFQSNSSVAASQSPPPQSSQQEQQQPNPDAQRPPITRFTLALSISFLTFVAGFLMAGAPAIEPLRALSNPPTDAETLELFVPSTEEVAAIEKSIFSHPLTRQLLQDEKHIPSRPHLKIPEKLRAQNLTGGTLLGPDKIAVPPLQFTTDDGSTFTSLQYLGPALCGHPGIVHGGLLATLLDEGLARCCFPALPNKVAVTASLKIDYKAPVMAGQVVVLKAETTKVEGRKAWVKGRLETLPTPEEWEAGKRDGVVLTEGEALFIEPRQAASMRRVVN